MRKILILGAGHSAPFLIHHLLSRAADLDCQITVGDLDGAAAQRRVAGHARGKGIAFDLRDPEHCAREFTDSDVVVSLVPPKLQALVARQCLAHGCHMVSASYRSREMIALDQEAKIAGLTLLCELGLDPGIDVMSGQKLIDGIRRKGGVVRSFCSYGGGLPEPAFDGNPLRYCVTWNPRNVAMAAEAGACFLDRNQIRLVPWHRMFAETWSVHVPGLGTMDAYPNRDSLAYRKVHGFEQIETLIRGTLRYPGFCNLWHQIVRLGLPNEQLQVPRLGSRTWGALTAMTLRPEDRGTLRERTARRLDLDPGDRVLDQMEWLGLFSDELVDVPGDRPTDALIALLERRLPLPPTARDLVVLHHELKIHYAKENRNESIQSTFLHYGDAGGSTAMARGVGLPAAIGVELLLGGEITERGVLLPVTPQIYGPILDRLEAHGLSFVDRIHPETKPQVDG